MVTLFGTAVLATLAFGNGPSQIAPRSPETTEGLTWPPLVAGKTFEVRRERFSIADEIFSVQLKPAFGLRQFAVYDLQGEWVRLTARIGAPDRTGGYSGESQYSVLLDGRPVVEGKIRRGQRAARIDVDLTGAKSLRLQIDGSLVIADPLMVRADSLEAKSTENLVPKAGAVLKPGSTKFAWKPVDGAAAYALELIAVEFDAEAQENQPRIWSFSTVSEFSFDIDLSKFPPGKYAWRVAPFDKRKQIGIFSKGTAFRVSK